MIEILLGTGEGNAACTVWVGGDSSEGGEWKGERKCAGKQEGATKCVKS